LARRLGYLYVDTGAMYRAVTWLVLQTGVDIHDGPALGVLARDAQIAISQPEVADGRQYTVTVQGKDVTWEIRSAAVTSAVSMVSSHPEVRSILIAQQRAIGHQQPVVMVGRDIGAIVLPDAERKFYLTASLEERTRRRYAELVERLGEANPALPSLQEVMRDIERRDNSDRENMQPAKDAILIETDHLSISEVLEVICSYME
jgi:cytidylate kinase